MAGIKKVTGARGVRYIVRYYDGSGAQRQKAFKSLELAKAHVRVEEGRAAAGDTYDVNAAKAPFGPIVEEWLKLKVFGKQRTEIGYRSLYSNQLKDTFGTMPVGRITKATIRAWISERIASGVGAGTVRNSYATVLRPALAHAVDAGYLRSNPATGIKLPTSEHVEMSFLSARQLRLLAECIGPHYSTLIKFDGLTGLRAGEIAGLRVGNLDLMRRTVRVVESASFVPGKGLTYTTPKTKTSIRTVPIPAPLIDELMALVAPRATDPEAFVFVTPQGKPIDHGSFMRRHFRPAVTKAVTKVEEMVEKAKAEGVEPAISTFPSGLRFHDLRHSAAAMMIDSTSNAHAVSKRLGHASITTTYDRYGHLFPAADESITRGLEDAWAEAEAALKTEAKAS